MLFRMHMRSFYFINKAQHKETTMNHISLDIETMGIGPNAPILSISACYFEPSTGEIGETFHQHIRLESAMRNGMSPDADTITWWLSQGKAAQNKLLKGQNDASELQIVLTIFKQFLESCKGNINNLQIWGNGPGFDNEKVKNAFETCGYKVPWKFWNDRCMRTIVQLTQDANLNVTPVPFEGVKHNVLDDCIHRAKIISTAYQVLLRDF